MAGALFVFHPRYPPFCVTFTWSFPVSAQLAVAMPSWSGLLALQSDALILKILTCPDRVGADLATVPCALLFDLSCHQDLPPLAHVKPVRHTSYTLISCNNDHDVADISVAMCTKPVQNSNQRQLYEALAWAHPLKLYKHTLVLRVPCPPQN